jgi:hypothetical protein
MDRLAQFEPNDRPEESVATGPKTASAVPREPNPGRSTASGGTHNHNIAAERVAEMVKEMGSMLRFTTETRFRLKKNLP